MAILTDPLPPGSNTIGAFKPAALQPKGYQQITGLTSATALNIPLGSTYAEIAIEGAAVRWREDGSNPTATIGMLMEAGSSRFHTTGLTALRLIQVSAGAVVNVHYYG